MWLVACFHYLTNCPISLTMFTFVINRLLQQNLSMPRESKTAFESSPFVTLSLYGSQYCPTNLPQEKHLTGIIINHQQKPSTICNYNTPILINLSKSRLRQFLCFSIGSYSPIIHTKYFPVGWPISCRKRIMMPTILKNMPYRFIVAIHVSLATLNTGS